jgi:hypothetical protein
MEILISHFSIYEFVSSWVFCPAALEIVPDVLEEYVLFYTECEGIAFLRNVDKNLPDHESF